MTVKQTPLQKAYETRRNRAQARRRVKSGSAEVAEVIDLPELGTMRVVDLLGWVPSFGQVKKVPAVMKAAGVHPSKTVAGLKPTERAALLESIANHLPKGP